MDGGAQKGNVGSGSSSEDWRGGNDSGLGRASRAGGGCPPAPPAPLTQPILPPSEAPFHSDGAFLLKTRISAAADGGYGSLRVGGTGRGGRAMYFKTQIACPQALPTRDTRHPTPDTRHPTPDTRHPTRDTRHATPDTRHAPRATRHPTRPTRHAPPDTRHAPRDTPPAPPDTPNIKSDRRPFDTRREASRRVCGRSC